MITNEMLSAYIDGELAPEEMERVARAIAADELLAARLVQFRRVDRLLTQLQQAQGLQRCAALMAGVFRNCEPRPESPSMPLAQVIDRQFLSLIHI